MKNSKGKWIHNLKSIAICVGLLAVVLAVILLLSKAIGGTDTESADGTEAMQEGNADTDVTETPVDGDTETAAEEAATEEETETETEQSTSIQLNNTIIENVASLDGTCQNWGQGLNFDELNRPASPLAFQEKYQDYSVAFIGDAGENGNTIYLTFDEGYEYGCTPRILATLKEKDVKAVFFVTKPYAETDPELVQQMIDEGHEIGNHSVTHPSTGLPSQTLEQQTNEVMENHQYILDNFGYSMHLFRFPAGKFSDQSLAIVNNCNYKSVFWSFAYADYDVNNQPDQAESLQKLVDRLHPGAIYLLHAESETNTAILGDFIDQAKAAGFEFELLQ